VVGHGLGTVRRRDVAADDLHCGKRFLIHCTRSSTAANAVRRVDDEDIDTGMDQGFDPLLGVAARSDRGAYAQAPELVLRGKRMLGGLGGCP